MKTIFFSLLLCAMTSSYLFAQSSEEQNIKKVIQSETNSYYKADADAWAKFWVHSPDASATYIRNGFYRRMKGWENFGPMVIKALKSPSNANMDVTTSADSFFIKSNGKIAFVTYKQKNTSKDPANNQNSFEKRVLVKENDGWKILSATTEVPESFDGTKPQTIEDNLNTSGYNLIQANRLNDAIEVFRLNVKLFPNSWNPYDSLGEALALAGDKDEAIKNYEKSMELNPNNTNGKTALEKLKAK
jgi:tetratricopeptide (TPR) repeat protein